MPAISTTRLTILGEPFAWKRGRAAVTCLCTCGTRKTVLLSDLKGGKVLSCWCLHRERAARMGKANATHGESASGPEYKAWRSMLDRCCRASHKHFDRYGGRGISVCQEWRDDYLAFLEHIGRRPSSQHSLDRIWNDGNYEPGNVRWATDQQQNRNRSGVVHLEYQGICLPVAEWADRTGIDQATIKSRLRRGWWASQALEIPPENKPLRLRVGSGIREWVKD